MSSLDESHGLTDQSDWIGHAINLANNAIPRAFPRPTVGAVIVKDGVLIAEGTTVPGGGLHAEAVALSKAGISARGADMYVTLEPHGYRSTQPPCTEAIIAAGIKRLVYAIDDPNPSVSGKGAEYLAKNGVQVIKGDGAAAATQLHEAFLHSTEHRRPFINVKFAATLDGKIAAVGGDSKWITGEEARGWAHRLRSTIDGIAVGSKTVMIDDPQLTARPQNIDFPERFQPRRIIFDSSGTTSATARVHGENTLFLTTSRSSDEWRDTVRQTGSQIFECDTTQSGQVEIISALDLLGDQNIQNVLVEGGPELLGSFFDAQAVNRIYAFLSPSIMGARDAPGAINGVGAQQMDQIVRLDTAQTSLLGEDILVTGIPHWPEKR
tara:strand:+ start:494 stop:1633 length:1140 start_codon:yes stop_codon:yes gene_type:complete